MSRMRNLSQAGVVLCVGWLLMICTVSMSGQQAAVASNASSTAVVPPLVSFNGVLTDVNGKPLTTVAGVTFALYKESQGGAPLWLETQNVYPDKTGHYTVLLGSTSSSGLSPDLFVAGEARWLAVQVQGQAEQPRTSLTSVPYSLKAEDAQTVGGLPASAFVLAAPPSSNPNSAAISSAVVVQPMATGTTPVTTAGGTVNKLAKFDATADITSSQIFDNGTNVGIGNTAPAEKLDVNGAVTVRGTLFMPAAGTATASAGYNSQALRLTASVFSSASATAWAPHFQWQAEPVGNDTASPSGTLNLLTSSGTATPAETGLKIASNGQITFAAGQTFPGVPVLAGANTFTGNQTVNGNVSAGQLISTVAPGTPPLQVASATLVPNLNATYLDGYAASTFQPAGSYATLGANTFTGNQTVNGTVQSTSGGFEFPDGSVQASSTTPTALDSNSADNYTVTGTVPGNGSFLFGGATASYIAGPNQVALIWVQRKLRGAGRFGSRG